MFGETHSVTDTVFIFLGKEYVFLEFNTVSWQSRHVLLSRTITSKKFFWSWGICIKMQCFDIKVVKTNTVQWTLILKQTENKHNGTQPVMIDWNQPPREGI